MPFWRKRFGKKYFEHPAYQAKTDSRRNLNRLDVIKAHTSRGRLLEIGFGNGAFLKMAARHFQAEGMDISKYAIDQAKDDFGNQVQIGDIETSPLPTRKFDVIVIFNVLEHLRSPRLALQNVYAALRKGGIMVGSVPLRYSLVGTTHALLTDFFDRTHISNLPLPRWQTRFKQAGFARINLFGEIMFGKNFNVYVHRPIWKHLALNLMFVCEK